MRRTPWLIMAALALAACGTSPTADVTADGADAAGRYGATRFTVEANAADVRDLPLEDRQEFDDATRGLLAHEDEVVIARDDGTGLVWDTRTAAFLDEDEPASVHPSLWRRAQLNRLHGLFEVVDGVYQVRGYDLANMTLVRGETGWIVVDPLTSVESARAAMVLAQRHLGERPVSAVLYTHSHVDHFGGVEGVISRDEVRRRGVRIVAPAGFTEEATSENVLAGTVMARRANFMFGFSLERGPRSRVDTGLAAFASARGRIGLIEPTELIDRTPQSLDIDGVEFVFQYTPDSEAPAEFTFYLPALQAFCGAEIVSQTLHNVLTPRGAKVRDALRWSGYIDEALHLFPDAEVLFASHHWPVWGRERVRDHLAKQRDTYKYIHDQSVRLAAAGLNPEEIAEEIELPTSLRQTFASRGYYGTVRHNAKAIYQLYFGLYDGNPANLDPLPPVAAGKKYVEFMGGPAEVRRKAQESLERGEYRWVATVLNHLVMAYPNDREGRELLARAYEQLGYQAESGPWRDIYLTGAHELRHGITALPSNIAAAMDLLRAVPVEQFFRAMATALNGPRADGVEMTINFVFTDLDETFVVTIENAVLHARKRPANPNAGTTVRLTHEFFLRMVTDQVGLRDLIFSPDLEVEGSRRQLFRFFRLLDRPDEAFPIVDRRRR